MMRLSCSLATFWLAAACALALAVAEQHRVQYRQEDHPPDFELSQHGKIQPKVFVVTMFAAEAEPWHERLPSSGLGDLLGRTIPVPGLSRLYPAVHCTPDQTICQMTTGESEINAAASVSALTLSELFDLRSTYFLFAGIAGVNPKLGTLGSVAVARFAVQVALQYELDARETPDDFATGYVAYGTKRPGEYPAILYGTEVMKLNRALGDAAFAYASKTARLADSGATTSYRALYGGTAKLYRAATAAPSLLQCDTATSDVYYSGNLLSEAFENTTMLWTNQSSLTYCMTAQEDNAVLASLMRAALAGRADYSRAVVLRSGSNFDRPPPNVAASAHLLINNQNGFDIAILNQYLVGVEIVRGLLEDWDARWRDGIPAAGYFGDILGSLGGEPDFGPGSVFNGTRPDEGPYPTEGTAKTRRGLARGSRGSQTREVGKFRP